MRNEVREKYGLKESKKDIKLVQRQALVEKRRNFQKQKSLEERDTRYQEMASKLLKKRNSLSFEKRDGALQGQEEMANKYPLRKLNSYSFEKMKSLEVSDAKYKEMASKYLMKKQTSFSSENWEGGLKRQEEMANKYQLRKQNSYSFEKCTCKSLEERDTRYKEIVSKPLLQKLNSFSFEKRDGGLKRPEVMTNKYPLRKQNSYSFERSKSLEERDTRYKEMASKHLLQKQNSFSFEKQDEALKKQGEMTSKCPLRKQNSFSFGRRKSFEKWDTRYEVQEIASKYLLQKQNSFSIEKRDSQTIDGEMARKYPGFFL